MPHDGMHRSRKARAGSSHQAPPPALVVRGAHLHSRGHVHPSALPKHAHEEAGRESLRTASELTLSTISLTECTPFVMLVIYTASIASLYSCARTGASGAVRDRPEAQSCAGHRRMRQKPTHRGVVAIKARRLDSRQPPHKAGGLLHNGVVIRNLACVCTEPSLIAAVRSGVSAWAAGHVRTGYHLAEQAVQESQPSCQHRQGCMQRREVRHDCAPAASPA